MYESSPVRMTTGSVTNNTDPNTDVSQGPRSGLRHLNRLWGLTIPQNTAMSAMTRSPIRWTPVILSPTSRASIAALSRPTEAQRNHGPTWRGGPQRNQPAPDPAPTARDPAAQPLRGAARDPPRIAAQADVAVDQQNCLPTAHSGQWLEYVTQQRRGFAP